MSNYPEKVYLNGNLINAQDARISVFDRGFLFGDGVYEVMAQMNGEFFFGKEHLIRLRSSLKKTNINFDVSTLNEKIERLLKAVELDEKDCLLYIQITRGVAPRKHSFPKDTVPTLLMYAIPFTLAPINNTTISVISQPDFRWHRCDIKMTSLLGNVMANDFAITKGHHEAVFHRDGKMTEGSHSNLFFVKDGTIYTHPADRNILNGITREIVLKLCRDEKIPFIEEAINFGAIHTMDEAFLTGTSTQIASIRYFDNHCFYPKNEVPAMTQKLQRLFLDLKNTHTS